MPQYIRVFVPGGTFFFTLTLLERRRKLLTENIATFGRCSMRPTGTGHLPSRSSLFCQIVTRVAAWPYSSFQRYVKRGTYNLDWAAADNARSLEME
jgi:hypothetical protein